MYWAAHNGHVSRLTSHVSRLTSHVSRLTSHVSRLTSHVSRLTSHVSRPRLTFHRHKKAPHVGGALKACCWSALVGQ
ncbi:hypothetical protein B6S08_10225 [Oceanimonas doudoroffii]|uniref:Uncharacterized protein n=1 Tax=Oceanimonas doudoroffii TaxID=84158 RepID=A0A233REK3_9GAMM|nr:hypothetical protein B6S08_10225 [Oceanimonas doudoroffii]